MELSFWKYQGTGNDFIMLHDPDNTLRRDDYDTIARLCHRRFGIGADGLICAEIGENGLWFMRYYNSDGRPSSFCGNGGRCFARFLNDRRLFTGTHLEFNAVDGPHEAIIDTGEVRLRMRRPYGFEQTGTDQYFIHTGSPHIVQFVASDPASVNLIHLAHSIRYNERFATDGVNVNIAHMLANGTIAVRTYERGVEDETWSCGTGVTAVAMVFATLNGKKGQTIPISTPGGALSVHTLPDGPWLIGPAVEVFQGKISI